jgi:ribose 5-phosphate isomerase B
MKPILIASDHGGFWLKERLRAYLGKKGLPVKDMGTFTQERCDYPLIAYSLANKIADGSYKKGLLICKSGIGNSIVANRLPGVRAALCYNQKAARLSRQHNDSNVLVLGALFVNLAQAERIVSVWLATGFSGSRHKRRLKQIRQIENKIRGRQG